MAGQLDTGLVLESLPFRIPVCQVQTSLFSPHSVHPISVTEFMSQVKKKKKIPRNQKLLVWRKQQTRTIAWWDS